MSLPPPGLSGLEVAQALATAHALVQQGQPLQALRVVAELLQAAGLEREAGESVCRVQQALAAGSSSAHAANELAGLMSLISLQATQTQQVQQQAPTPMGAQYQQQQQQFSSGSEPAGMEVEGGTGPGPPPPHLAPADNEASRLAELAAAAEGASYMCPRCGGMVAVARFEAHQQLWCPARQGNG